MGAQSQETPPLLMPITSSGSPGYLRLGYKSEVPRTPSQVRLICWSGSQSTEGQSPTLTSLVKDVIQDTEEQPDEETHRRAPGGSQAQELLSRGAEAHDCLTVDAFTPRSSLNPGLLGLYGDFLTEA